MSATTVAIFLGHDGIDPDEIGNAGEDIRLALRMVDATTLSEGNTYGEWNGTREAGEVWLATVPESEDLGYLAESLAYVATRYGQDAIGYLIHDHATRPNSYVTPEVPQ